MRPVEKKSEDTSNWMSETESPFIAIPGPRHGHGNTENIYKKRLAVQAVSSKPVSGLISCLTGKKQGIFTITT